jgi:hypothetical protein
MLVPGSLPLLLKSRGRDRSVGDIKADPDASVAVGWVAF